MTQYPQQPFAPPTAVPPTPRAVPRWVLVLVAVFSGAMGVGIGAMYLLGAAFACDSGGSSCAEVGSWSIMTYLGVTAVGLLAALILGLVSSSHTAGGRARRVVSVVLIPLMPVIAVAAGIAVYAIGFSYLNR